MIGESNKCAHCGEPAIDGKEHCEECVPCLICDQPNCTSTECGRVERSLYEG